MAYKDFTAADRAFCLSMEKCGEAIIPNDKERQQANQAGVVFAIALAMQILRDYIQGKENNLVYELYDSSVQWLKFATLSLKKTDLEEAVSKFLNAPSLNTALDAYQAYDNLAEHIGLEFFKDEVKQEIKKAI